MSSLAERAAVVALLRNGRWPWQEYADMIEDAGSALAILEEEEGLLASERLADAREEIERWQARGMQPVTLLDPVYPANLRAVHDRPPLIFVSGQLQPGDGRSVAVVGTRLASPEKARIARAISEHLVDHGYTVVSGLASGIDTAVHTAALAHGGRTLAVIGTGLARCYPPQNARLQRRIAGECAVISQFWPDTPPSRRSFPMRNAVISGLTLATVVVEASRTSGSRLQTRLALAQGRSVLLVNTLLDQQWARELSKRSGTYVVGSAGEITDIVERLTSSSALTA
ncbi:MAG: DNA-processing protein DprA [Solirubrobacteraceae bacterium]